MTPKEITQRHYPDAHSKRTAYTYQIIATVNGAETAVPIVDGDWIIPEPDGEHFYPCKPDIFAATYDPLPSDSEAINQD